LLFLGTLQDALNEHFLRPGVDMEDEKWFNRSGDRIIWVFDHSIPLGCFPMSRFATGHGYSVQRLHKVRIDSASKKIDT